MNSDYVDVRGVWPLFIVGLHAQELRGAHRTITVAEARVMVEKENALNQQSEPTRGFEIMERRERVKVQHEIL